MSKVSLVRTVGWPGWETVRRIGSGGFGTVYEIQRDVYGRLEKAALKVITIPHSEDEVDYLRCTGLTDANITQTLHKQVADIAHEYNLMVEMRDNPNVVRCDDFRDIQHEDGLGWDIYIKMELLTPLMKCLDKVQTEEQILKLGMDICNALIACQEKNIIHRDIKPQNIFISDKGQFKLGDFGIARTAERTTRATAGIGTYSYMAPEVEKNEAYGKTADIYSLGLVLYWLLNEKRSPFIPLPPAVPGYGDEENARNRRFHGEQIPAPKNGSEELKAIVLKACAYDPKERYQSAKEMLRALETLQTRKTSVIETMPATNPLPTEAPAVDEDLTVGPNWSNKAQEPAEDTMTVGPVWHKSLIGENDETTVGPVFAQRKETHTKVELSSKPTKKNPKRKKWWFLVVAIVVCIGIGLFSKPSKKAEGLDKNIENKENTTVDSANMDPFKGECVYTIDDTNPSLVYEKDADGNVVKTTYKDPNGDILAWYESTYSVDDKELIRKGYYTDGTPMFTYMFAYDQEGLIITVEESKEEWRILFDPNGNVIEKGCLSDSNQILWSQYRYDDKNREIHKASDSLDEMYIVTEYLEDALPDKVIENEIWMLPGDQVSQVVEKVHRDSALESYTVWNIDGSGNRIANAIATYEPLGSSKWMIEKFVRESDKSESTSYRLFDEAGNEVGVIGLAPDGRYSNHFIRVPDVLGGNTFTNYDIPVPVEKHGHVLNDGCCSYCGTIVDAGNASIGSTLMADNAMLMYDNSGNHIIPPVFGSEILRTEIKTITFRDSIDNIPETAWDVSEKKNGSVWAWVEPDMGLYNLFIAGQGGVVAPENCEMLFAQYYNLEKIDFNGCFRVQDVTNTARMFYYCTSLKELDLSMFDTSKVTSMHQMFCFCEKLKTLDISHFDVSKVKNMSGMFFLCSGLESLQCFDISNTEADTSYMFDYCFGLGAVWNESTGQFELLI